MGIQETYNDADQWEELDRRVTHRDMGTPYVLPVGMVLWDGGIETTHPRWREAPESWVDVQRETVTASYTQYAVKVMRRALPGGDPDVMHSVAERVVLREPGIPDRSVPTWHDAFRANLLGAYCERRHAWTDGRAPAEPPRPRGIRLRRHVRAMMRQRGMEVST